VKRHLSSIRTNGLLFISILGIIAPRGETSALGQTYHLTDLGVLPGQTISHPAGINNQGEVVGVSGPRAVRFALGAVEDLGTLTGGNQSTAVAINDLGTVAGDSQFQDGGSIRHATLFRNGTLTDLGFLPSWGNYSRATGINEAGDVVGFSGASLGTSNTRAFVWDPTNGMRDLGTLGGQYAKALSINNSSVVTGTSQIGSGFGNFHAFIWDAANGMRDIGTIAGDTSSGAFINQNGHVAGTSTINGFDNRQHAFLYDGVVHDLGAVGNNDFYSDRSSASGINIHDHVVGTTYRPYQGGGLYSIAFIYRDGQMHDLESMVDASGADYRLYTATGINDVGQIAVDAIKVSTNEIRAVLLTPTGMSTPTPTPVPPPTPTPTPAMQTINISGTISYCSNPVPGPVSNVTLTLTGSGSGAALSDDSGNYSVSALPPGGSYIVTPMKSALPPGSMGINTLDVIATQRHFLALGTPLSECRLTAADVNGDIAVNTLDVIAIQRFFLQQPTGIANTGRYQFTPTNRSYLAIVSNQPGQNYDALILGDVAPSFADSLDELSQTASYDSTYAGEVTATVAAVALPEVGFREPMLSRVQSGSIVAAVRTSVINAKSQLVGFQGDMTFDERVITFQSEPVQKAGLTGGNWNVSGNVLPGHGPIRTLRLSAYSNDFTPLAGEGTLFELRMSRAGQAAQGTALIWAAPPNHFFFINADLETRKPIMTAPNNLESGTAATLAPGQYTVLLAGVNDSAGIGLVEVYDRGATP
jgi:probable HAF family extracellular repeat protein